MPKDNNVQTRVGDDVYDFLSQRANARGVSMSEYLRELLTDVTDARRGADGTIKQRLLGDIVNIGEEDGGLMTTIDRDWAAFCNSDGRARLRTLLLNEADRVYLVGQGSSLAAAKWLAARLRDRGVHASATSAQRVPQQLVGENDVVVCISRSGRTVNLIRLCKTVEGTVATVTAVGSDLYENDNVDVQVPLPTLEERLDHYSKQNFVSQLLVLQELLTAEPATVTTIRDRLAVIRSFIQDHTEHDEGGVSLRSDSAFHQTAAKLNHEDDIDLDLIATGTGRYTSHCHEFVQKYPELLYKNAVYEDPGSIRDRLLNLLYTEQALLCSIIPRNAENSSGDYQMMANHLFQNRQSVDNLLKFNPEPKPLRLLCLTFNEASGSYEQVCTSRSLYGDDSVIVLPHHDEPFINDLILYVAIYLLVYAILDRKWEQHPRVRQAIIRRVFTPDESLSEIS